ncbi:MAG: choice-of-anchor tandem repeat GloVer-containing protein [Candidatus Sulfotelmatobacter sp.]
MRNGICLIGLTVALSILSATLFAKDAPASPPQYKILHDFTCSGTDGCEPNGGLVFDNAGNLYGTTLAGGTSTSCVIGCGTVFELFPKAGGGWGVKLLHSFSDNRADGYYPAAGVILDSSGNLYGTTTAGGTATACPGGCGTVFELSPDRAGGWTEKVLYSFNPDVSTDGFDPEAGLILDASGNLYGTTGVEAGTAFELTPSGGGTWTETNIYIFPGGVPGPGWPMKSGLIFAAAGNLYGTTFYSGRYDGCSQYNAGFGCGTVYQLTPSAAGTWTATVLYSFGGTSMDGYYPDSGVVFDAVGNLYGTTAYGGNITTCKYLQIGGGCGTAFELSPTAGGNWTETILHNFGASATDGTLPSSGLIFGKAGNLYGTTQNTGNDSAEGYGTVFALSPKAGGNWSEKILHNFAGGKSGAEPSGNLTIDAAGNLYGTAGVVFEVIP